MKLHHQKHHQTYVNGLNAAEESYASAQSTKEQIKLQSALKFNGGGKHVLYRCAIHLCSCSAGHINHSLFWKNLAPASGDGGKLPDGPLKQAIERDFGTVEDFKKKFNTTTAAVQGSGWGWLVRIYSRNFECFRLTSLTGIQSHHKEARGHHDPQPGPLDKHVPLPNLLTICADCYLSSRADHRC